MRTQLALAAAGLLLIATPVMAADRSDRDRSNTPAPAQAPAPAAPSPVLPGHISTPSYNSGSINSNSNVSTNSGGNQGGSVTTGDQSATINVVNVGPVNQNTQVITPAPQPTPAPGPQCTGRTCPRTR